MGKTLDQLAEEIEAAGWCFSLRLVRLSAEKLVYHAYVWNADPERSQLDFADTPTAALSEALRRYRGNPV
jgi:hypothetical protein